MKSLLIKGGYAVQLREIRVTESNRWEYFPESNNKKTTTLLHIVVEREEGNKDVCVSVSHVTDDYDKMLNEKENDKENKTSYGTHCICNLNKLEDYMNRNLCCNCHVDNVLLDFIEYYDGIDIDSTYQKLAALHAQYKYVIKKGAGKN